MYTYRQLEHTHIHTSGCTPSILWPSTPGGQGLDLLEQMMSWVREPQNDESLAMADLWSFFFGEMSPKSYSSSEFLRIAESSSEFIRVNRIIVLLDGYRMAANPSTKATKAVKLDS